MTATAKYIVGIDLGTSNTVVSYADAALEKGQDPEIRVFHIPQLVNAGEVLSRPVLPSFTFVPGSHDVSETGTGLPWDSANRVAVGEFARNRGAEIPDRLISSAKSWLCNPFVDKSQPILPWQGTDPESKMSPVEASSRILAHVRDAWNHEMAAEDPEAKIENQVIYLTVPASFDADARELTVLAAYEAGFSDVTLLEEPQAAFYAWISESGGKWRDHVAVGDKVLICDVGGGTTDFSLIEVTEAEGDLQLERVAVGEHLLVGGDNMDLALAYTVAGKLSQKGTKLDAWQMRSLGQHCRSAKEQLLGEGSGPGTDTIPISLLGRGSSLIGGTIRTDLQLVETRNLVVDGFFPVCGPQDMPAPAPRTGLKEFGLTYESDPAVTKHLAKFLSQGHPESGRFQKPTAVFFNGGVMKAGAVRQRILSLLSDWCGHEVREIQTHNYDLSVAIGASYFGASKASGGVRIRGGLGKSYYISIAASMPAIPGMPLPTRALCVAPFGMEEGTSAVLEDREFVLVVGDSVHFDVLNSAIRFDDAFGTVVDDWEQDIDPLTRIETTLDGDPGTYVPVHIEVKVTEIGTLEFWCTSTQDDRRWKLEFSVREKEAGA